MIYDVFRVKVTLEVRENGQDAKRAKFLMKTNTVVLTFSLHRIGSYKTKL